MLAAWIQPWIQPDNESKLGPKLYLIPMSGAGDPRRALASLPDQPPGEVQFSWLPDGRHIVVALTEHIAGTHLSLVDLQRESVRRLTMGTERENFPAVPPSITGELRLLRSERTSTSSRFPAMAKGIRKPCSERRFRSRSLDGRRGPRTPLSTSPIATANVRSSDAATTAARRTDSWSAITSRTDPRTSSETQSSITPDGQRIAYTRARGRGHGWQIWVSTIGGAAPQPLVADIPGSMTPGLFQDLPTWSSDNWIAFNQMQWEGSRQLLEAQVGSGQAQKPIYQDILPYPPPWSPDGRLLACQTREGLTLITSEGAKDRVVTPRLFLAYDWDESGILNQRPSRR